MTDEELFALAKRDEIHFDTYSTAGLIPGMHIGWTLKVCDKHGRELGAEGFGKTEREAALAALRDHYDRLTPAAPGPA